MQIATTTKLIRALWIIPVSLIVAFTWNRGKTEEKAKISIPWFIFLYIVAMLVATYFPQGQTFYVQVVGIAKMGLVYTLFLIGTGLSKSSIQEVGFRPVLLGIILWIIISVLSATVILWL